MDSGYACLLQEGGITAKLLQKDGGSWVQGLAPCLQRWHFVVAWMTVGSSIL